VRVLVDVNVCLDVPFRRAPFAEASSTIWSLAEEGRIEGLVPAHGVTTVHDLLSATVDAATARRFVADLMKVFEVASVDRSVLQRALGLGMPDFEDAVCAAAAEASGCDLVVTRNSKDFGHSPVTAVDPITALALVEGSGSAGVSERAAGYRGRRRPRVARTRRGRTEAGAR